MKFCTSLFDTPPAAVTFVTVTVVVAVVDKNNFFANDLICNPAGVRR